VGRWVGGLAGRWVGGSAGHVQAGGLLLLTENIMMANVRPVETRSGVGNRR
jgi:hypothetical protein